MIPERLSVYGSIIPLLHEVTEWSLLRRWSLSEVYRVTLKSGETRIIKWGGQEMAGETAIYQQLVRPLKIKSLRIFEFYELKTSAIMIMEDAGRDNLEQRPEPDLFLEAARELANLQKVASANLGANLPSEIQRAYTVSASDFLALLDDLLKSNILSENNVLSRLQNTFPFIIDELYRTTPLTLVHHDYHAKNLTVIPRGSHKARMGSRSTGIPPWSTTITAFVAGVSAAAMVCAETLPVSSSTSQNTVLAPT